MTSRAMTLPEACRWMGAKLGKTPATSTAWRWALRGVRGGIKLEVFRIGGTTYTTPEFIDTFIERTTGSMGTKPASSSTATKHVAATPDHDKRRKEITAACEQLHLLCQPKRGRARSRDGS